MGSRKRYEEDRQRGGRRGQGAGAKRTAAGARGARGAGARTGRMAAGRERQELRPRRMLTPTNLLVALVGFLFLLTLSVVLVLNLRTIYYFDIRFGQLEQQTGLTEEVIRENYDVLIDYNLITKHVKELEFPDFPMSEHGRIHFAEVKRIFVLVQYLCIVSGVVLAAALFKKWRRRDYGSLKLMSVLTFLLPIVLGALAAVNWNAFFITFHELFFDNTYWIFNPATDPVIRILPDLFFFHCAMAILLFLLLGAILTGALYRLATRRYRRREF